MEAQDFGMLNGREHVILRPGMYIGSVENTTSTRWVFDIGSSKMIQKEVTYNPGLEQCVLELITNATDRSHNPEYRLSKIDVVVTDDTISITNDGIGIPIEVHEKHGIYIPEMIFGNMLSGSNFTNEKRIVGGQNGIGAKAANIFSDLFTVITVRDCVKYEQTFSDRMSTKNDPKITKTRGKDYTKIIFKPCLSAFGMKNLHENDTVSLIHKRTIDASAITHKKVVVTYNGERVPVKDFQDYMDLYIGPKSETPRVYFEPNERWAIGFALNRTPFSIQISFVNGICTEEGGTHVTHVMEPILNKIVKELEGKKEYKDIPINKKYVQDNIVVFVRSLVENPTFSSQTKTQHTTKVSNFGSKVTITDDIVKKVIKLGVTQGILEIAKAKELRGLKKTDGKKKIRLNDIPKLDDAHWAGTSKSTQCTLILTEGDSGKTMALAGLAVVGKDRYGVFPLKGKLLNTRDIALAKIAKNEEICNINKILGLVHGKKYQTLEGLRYGKVMIATDADVDGFHIRGLIINYLECFWPELLQNGFVCSLLTPIVKVFHGNMQRCFYNIPNYQAWKESTEGSSRWRVKYYKGLGTSTAKEAKEYFQDIERNRVGYRYVPQQDKKYLELAFADSKKKNTDRRKDWITRSLGSKQDQGTQSKDMSIGDFINKELVQFSIYDNERSIPHVMDGLKISQRKVLYSCLKRNLFTKSDGSGEIKVAQLAGYVSEHSAYHHGEVSLQGTIVGMAQDFVGSGNNMNLLYPSGQFGSRQANGKDSASARYIYTYLQPYVRDIFNEYDGKLLNYLDDDGYPIEPEFYVPTIPMILVNGTEGIGTGWSTTIPCFNPKDIVRNLRSLIEDENNVIHNMDPWYRGFKGKIQKVDTNEWVTEGVIEIERGEKDTYVRVLELPVGTVAQMGAKSIQDFKKHLDILEQQSTILYYDDSSTDVDVNFKVVFKSCDVCYWDPKKIKEVLKLYSCIKTTNMHAFNTKGVIQKYESPEQILWEFFNYRRKFYSKRKKYLVTKLGEQWDLESNKARFIKMVIDNELVVFRKSKEEIVGRLGECQFKKIDGGYRYLLDIRIHSFTKEKLEELGKLVDKLGQELKILKDTKPTQLWESDLARLPID